MIYLYTGTPGSGKSLHTAEQIVKWIKIYKSPVIANFSFDISRIKFRGYASFILAENNKINPEMLIRFSEVYRDKRKWQRVPEEHILLIIDECQLLFNCRSWNAKDRADWISFFTQHRKLGYRIILICQFAEMIDKQIRSLVEYEYVHRKVNNIGIYGKVLNTLAFGRLHVAVKMYSPLREKVGVDFFKGNKNLYELYDSYNRF